jgi:hypothetical protein
MNNEDLRGRKTDAARAVKPTPIHAHEHIAAAVEVKSSLWPQRLANPQTCRILSIFRGGFLQYSCEPTLLSLALC